MSKPSTIDLTSELLVRVARGYRDLKDLAAVQAVIPYRTVLVQDEVSEQLAAGLSPAVTLHRLYVMHGPVQLASIDLAFHSACGLVNYSFLIIPREWFKRKAVMNAVHSVVFPYLLKHHPKAPISELMQDVYILPDQDAGLVFQLRAYTKHPDTPIADWLADSDDDAVRRFFDKTPCRVHEGVWNTTDSVYDWICGVATEAHVANKTVWLTGHSLGGAMATLAAARLHYDDRIPVAGVHTFGSFKVGDSDFAKMLTLSGADGSTLNSSIQRWAVNGDFATTLFYRDLVPNANKPGGRWVYYQHVGRTHQITRSGHVGYVDWAIDFNTTENVNMFATPLSLAPFGEHGDYLPALRTEIIRRLDSDAESDHLTALLSIEL